MAEATIKIDDITGEPLDDSGETILFSYRGKDYKIDLTAANASGFDKFIEPFIDRATQITRAKPPRRVSRRELAEQAAKIRKWAADHPAEAGMTLSERGRIPNVVIRRWEASQQGGPAPVE